MQGRAIGTGRWAVRKVSGRWCVVYPSGMTLPYGNWERACDGVRHAISFATTGHAAPKRTWKL